MLCLDVSIPPSPCLPGAESVGDAELGLTDDKNRLLVLCPHTPPGPGTPSTRPPCLPWPPTSKPASNLPPAAPSWRLPAHCPGAGLQPGEGSDHDLSYSPGVLQPLGHGHKGSRDPVQLFKQLCNRGDTGLRPPCGLTPMKLSLHTPLPWPSLMALSPSPSPPPLPAPSISAGGCQQYF